MPITLKQGDRAPAFSLRDAEGKDVSLSSLAGSRVVLYFYPKDDTPGCTTEACSFRDALEDYRKRGIVVLGVSPDSSESHASFRDKHKLSFPLLADPTHEVATQYGAWGKRIADGKTSFDITRSTFLIDEDGNILNLFKQVSPEGHASEVLAAFGDR
jgi:peroxiredoxin Q/BCP